MEYTALQAIRTTASAFELLLALLLIPSVLSHHPDQDDPDYMLRVLLFSALGKFAVDFAAAALPDLLPVGAGFLATGALEILAATCWYVFVSAYLWSNWRTTSNAMRLSLAWLLPWVVLAGAAVALHGADTAQGGLYQALRILTLVPLILAEVLLASRHENLRTRDVAILGLFPLPTVLGVVLSLLVPDLELTSPGLSLGLLAVCFYLQSRNSQKDPLTGAHTRSWFKARLTERLKDARTAPFLLLMIDLDHFKKINDTWGHMEGDKALVTVVELLRKSLRSSDLVARFAGDEFLVLANVSNEAEGDIILRRMRDNLLKYNLSSGKPYSLSWSTGTLYCDKPRNPDELLANVDAHMYRAKKGTRK